MMKPDIIITTFITIGLVLLDILQASNTSGSGEKQLMAYLKQGYQVEARPVNKASESVQVNLSLQMVRLDQLNTKSQVISMMGWITVNWFDYGLVWNTSDYEGLDYVTVLPSEVWIPTFAMSNSVSDQIYNNIWYSLFKVRVRHDGYMTWLPGGIFKAECTVDVYLFPFDDQICHFKFENWVYTGDKVNLSLSASAESLLLAYYTGNNGEWDVIGSAVRRYEFVYNSIPVPYPQVHFALHLKRKSLFYITNIILLSVLLAVLVLMMFKLPAESGERISMGVTLLLSFSVFILMINNSIPETSSAVPIIIVYLICFMGVTTLGIGESVLALYCFHHDGKSKPPEFIRKFFQRTMFRKSHRNIQIVARTIAAFTQSRMKEDQDEKNVLDWQNFSRSLDVLTFWVCLVCFCLLFLVLLVLIPYGTPLKDIDQQLSKWAP